LEIVHHPHPALRRRAAPIAEIDDDVRQKAGEMIDLMFEARGIGLAGNQPVHLVRIIVICPTAERGEERVLINPRILETEDEAVAEEGCLSFPRMYAKVPRAARIRYTYTDLDGKAVEREAEDLEARVVQHELDHLDGIVFTMRMTPVDQLAHRKSLKELERQYKERNARESTH